MAPLSALVCFLICTSEACRRIKDVFGNCFAHRLRIENCFFFANACSETLEEWGWGGFAVKSKTFCLFDELGISTRLIAAIQGSLWTPKWL